MFYRQKINELCYMYVYLGTVQCLCMYYVVKLSVHVHTCTTAFFILAHSTRSRFSSGSSAQILLVGRTNLPFRGRFPTSSGAAASVVSGQLQQSKYRAAIFDPRSITQSSQGKQLLNYSITARATILPFPSTPQHIVCAQLLPSYLLHLLIFLLSIEQVANHEAPVCIGGHRSRGGPVSQC